MKEAWVGVCSVHQGGICSLLDERERILWPPVALQDSMCWNRELHLFFQAYVCIFLLHLLLESIHWQELQGAPSCHSYYRYMSIALKIFKKSGEPFAIFEIKLFCNEINCCLDLKIFPTLSLMSKGMTLESLGSVAVKMVYIQQLMRQSLNSVELIYFFIRWLHSTMKQGFTGLLVSFCLPVAVFLFSFTRGSCF